ncbi:hypothetical protein [Streptomyces sp.]|uniref:hypothetical protein n=1 Tax=Streptomyces sp. TaxID=1931 RepID=UPI002F94720A
MTTENDAARLLLWINAQSEGDILCAVSAADRYDAEWYHFSEARVIMLIEHLANRGLVDNRGTSASGLECRITPAGVIEAERLSDVRDNPRRRFDFAADALVAAAMELYPRARVELGTFVGTRHMWFYDRVLELDEVQRAVDHLEKAGLAMVERSPVQAQAVTLTALGIECGSHDKVSVRNFLNEHNQQQPSVQNEFKVTVHGGAPQIGTNNVQHNTFGYDPQQLASFAREVLAAAHTADVPEEARATVLADAGALQAELAAAEPESSRVRQLTERLLQSAKQNLPALGWTAAAQIVAGSMDIPLF